MMHALVSDAQQLGLNLGAFGYKTKKGYACSLGPYEYVCSPSAGSTCMEDDSGCASWPTDVGGDGKLTVSRPWGNGGL